MPRHTTQDGLQALSDSVSVLNQAKTPGDGLKAFPSILAMARLAAKRGGAEAPSSTIYPRIARMGDILSNPHQQTYSSEKKLVTQILTAVSEALKPTTATKTLSQPLDKPKPSAGKTEAPTIEPSPNKLKPK